MNLVENPSGSSEVEIPSILILKAMEPKEVGGRLESHSIDSSLSSYEKFENEMWRQYLASDERSLESENLARVLGKYYLLKTSQNLSSPELWRRSSDREIWAQRFTQASSEMYQAPQLVFVHRIASEQLSNLSDKSGPNIDRMYDAYKKIKRATEHLDGSGEQLKALSPEQVIQFKNELIDINKDWFDYLDANKQEVYSPKDAVRIINVLFKIRAETDSGFTGWKAEIEEGNDKFKVLTTDSTVYVGENRSDMTHNQLTALITHELAVHCASAVNGKKSGDDLISEGLPGYLDFHESLGIAAEYFVTGKLPDKAYDRYLDIALAMGLIEGVRKNRRELFEFALTRSLARIEVSGVPISQEMVDRESKDIKTHINRIFRGGDGQEGENPAVFTKDAVYYPAEVENFMVQALEKGASTHQIMAFLLQGKFDPGNETHMSYPGIKPIELFS